MSFDHAGLHGMVCDAARRILSAPLNEVQGEVDAALGALGLLIGATRAQLFLAGESGGGTALAEWTDPDVADNDAPQGSDTVDPERFPWIAEHLRRLEPIEASVEELPDEADADRQRLVELGTRWLLAVPVPREALLGGALVLRSAEPVPPIEPTAVDLVELLADVLLHSLVRQRAEAELRRSRGRARARLRRSRRDLARERAFR